jgi:hypothetical protein
LRYDEKAISGSRERKRERKSLDVTAPREAFWPHPAPLQLVYTFDLLMENRVT